MSEYRVWFDTKKKTSTSIVEVRKTSIVEIRKAVMKQPKDSGYNIYCGYQQIARMYFARGNWVYVDYHKMMYYNVKKDGHISEGQAL